MINFTSDFYDDVERTQRLPLLTTEVQLDEALQRERAAQIQIVELMRQNFQQATEIERFRAQRLTPATEEPHATTEEKLFEVCGALKDTLSRVLNECRTQGVALNCASTAARMLDDSCDKFEQILSAPGFSAATAMRTHESRPARVPHLELLLSEPRSTHGN